MYRKGVRYEYKIKKQLESEGWNVTRSAGSHGLFDLIAIGTAHHFSSSLGNPHEAKKSGALSTMGCIYCGVTIATEKPCSRKSIKLIQLKTGKTAKREKEKVLEDIRRWEGLYFVSVEVL